MEITQPRSPIDLAHTQFSQVVSFRLVFSYLDFFLQHIYTLHEMHAHVNENQGGGVSSINIEDGRTLEIKSTLFVPGGIRASNTNSVSE